MTEDISMNTSPYRTEDIYLSAYLLATGHNLKTYPQAALFQKPDGLFGILCVVTASAHGKDSVIHGLGTKFDGPNRVWSYGFQSIGVNGIRSGRKTDAVHKTLFNKPLGFIQKGLNVGCLKAEKITPVKGHLDPAPTPILKA